MGEQSLSCLSAFKNKPTPLSRALLRFFLRHARCGLGRLCALAGLLRVAGYDLDLLGHDGWVAVIHLKVHVLNQERPDFVAEPIGVKAAL